MVNTKENFFEMVYQVVELIPSGKVSTYGAIARYLGSGRSARMVGWALNQSFSKNIPAHRVVNQKGLLTGKMFFGNPNKMAELLIAEGVEVKNDQVQKLENYLWDPEKELREG